MGWIESVYLGARKQEAREGGHMPWASFLEPNLLSVKLRDSAGLSKARTTLSVAHKTFPSLKSHEPRKTATYPVLVDDVAVKNRINKMYPPHQFSNLNLRK